MAPLTLVLFAVLLLVLILPVQAVCPHCNGGIPSCAWSSSNKVCPSVATVANNALIVAAGTGVLTLAGVLKPRFLRIFSLVSFETILNLVKRTEPGTSVTIDATTSSTAILTAIRNGRLSVENAVFKLCELIEGTSDAAEVSTLTRRLECLKMAADIHSKVSASTSFNGLFDTGILTFMWAKVSEFVMKKDMQVKLHIDAAVAKASETTSAL